jgi:hypothetical protein
MRIETALYQLRNQPRTFLENNLLRLAGGGPSQVRVNYFCHWDDIAAGVNEGFTIDTYPRHMPGATGQVHKAMQVHNVQMIGREEGVDVTAIEPYVLGGGGPDLMVTGQLNACVFVVQQTAGQLVVAHIQPGGALQTGSMLRQTMKVTGRFAGHGRVTHVFGLGGDYSNYAYVIGVRRGGQWELYGQRTAGRYGPIQGVTRIV